MLPKVVVHNSISLDGSLTGFEPNMQLHYQIAGEYRAGANLIGSNTVSAGVELFEDGVPPEERVDFEKPKRDAGLPHWVILDTRGKLKGLLHTCRRFELCRNVIVFVSEATPQDYVKYLQERKYDYRVVGDKQINLESALELLSSTYGAKRVLVDTGRVLGNLLLERGLASELSLLVHPVIVGKKAYNIFGNIQKNMNLNLYKKKVYPKGFVWLNYKVKKLTRY
jgi:2,5-diamino-6-(ribosylamino)-4(3H)-pyrimidinone 5'-phosphate reductase